jgi:hypothetical protein
MLLAANTNLQEGMIMSSRHHTSYIIEKYGPNLLMKITLKIFKQRLWMF